jgi:hypothetical protein
LVAAGFLICGHLSISGFFHGLFKNPETRYSGSVSGISLSYEQKSSSMYMNFLGPSWFFRQKTTMILKARFAFSYIPHEVKIQVILSEIRIQAIKRHCVFKITTLKIPPGYSLLSDIFHHLNNSFSMRNRTL